MTDLCVFVFLIACIKLWINALLHYKYVMVKRVALGKTILANQLTIEQIINKTRQEIEDDERMDNQHGSIR
jgi:hypothetical protein